MIKTNNNEDANRLIGSIMEIDGTTDTRLNRCFKVEKLESLFLLEKSSFFFENFVEEVCIPFVRGGVSINNLPAVVAKYDF
jgi:hypothetical protein